MLSGNDFKYYWNGQLVWTPALGLYLWGREDVNVTSNVELRNYVPLFGMTQLNVDLRNYVISRQIVICYIYLNIVVSLDCYWTYLLEYV